MPYISLPCAPASWAPLRLTAAMAFALVSCSTGPQGADLTANKTDEGTQALTNGSSRSLTPQAGPGMCLQPQNKSYNNGTPVVLAPCDGSSQQTWTFINNTLRVGDTHCLDVADGRNRDGARLQLWDCATNNTNQRWSEANNVYTWVGTNKCLDMAGNNNSAGAIMGIWTCNGPNNNQIWLPASGTNSAAQPSNTSDTGSGNNAGSGAMSGYVHTSGTNIVDGSGKVLRLRGTNIGGWLVTENWMNGMVDASDNSGSSTDNSVGRFAKETLESRFGEAGAMALMNLWYDNFFTTQDLDNIKNMGMNVIRVPFGYRNLQRADGSWVRDGSGNIDFSRLDWVVNEAGKRGIYVIPDLHIWRTQRENYQLISTNTDGGKAAQAQAAALWREVAKHFKGNSTIAAFDVINEPTGSYANMMQIALYNAVREQDSSRMIVMESMEADPASLGWNNVVYSIHQYGMMGYDFGTNQNSFNNDLNGSVRKYRGYNIPVYVGEYMVQGSGPTLPWLLSQYNANNLGWSSWTYKAVNLGSWGFYNLSGNLRVNVLSDSYETIRNAWSNLGPATPEMPLINAVKSATSG